MVLCSLCKDTKGIYQLPQNKKNKVESNLFCKSCAAEVCRCVNCSMDAYTVIQSYEQTKNNEKLELRNVFRKNLKIGKEHQENFEEMGKVTTLYGSSEDDSVKNLNNFFQSVPPYLLKTKGQNEVFCKVCLVERVEKVSKSICSRKQPNPDKCFMNWGNLGILTDETIVNSIFSFLDWPNHIRTVQLVHPTWKDFLTKVSDLSFIHKLVFTSKLRYPSESKLTPKKLSTQNHQLEVQRKWSDKSILLMLKEMKYNFPRFKGFPNVNEVLWDDCVGVQEISDYGLLSILHCCNPDTLKSINFRNLSKITWFALSKFFTFAKNNIESVAIQGSELCNVVLEYYQDVKMFPRLKNFKRLTLENAGRISLSILQHLYKSPRLHHLGVLNSEFYWPKDRSSMVIPKFKEITSLDLYKSTLTLRNSLVEILEYFPSVEDIRVTYVQRKEFVSKVPMFQRANERSPTFIDDVIASLDTEAFKDNDLLVKKGDLGTEMYFIGEGTVSVVGSHGEIFANLERGDFFGEISLLYPNLKRTANIRAKGPCTVYILRKDDLYRILRKHPLALEIIKDEAKKRLAKLAEAASSASDTDLSKIMRDQELSTNTGVSDGESTIGQPHDLLLDGLGKLYSKTLKSLVINGKDMELDFDHHIIQQFPHLETLDLELRTGSKDAIGTLPIIFHQSNELKLKSVAFRLSQAEYYLPEETLRKIFKQSPELCHFHYDLTMDPLAIEGLSSCPKLKVLDIMACTDAKSLLTLIKSISLKELRTSAFFMPEQLISVCKKDGSGSENVCQFKILDIPKSIFTQTQLKDFMQGNPLLEYLCVQSSISEPIHPKLFNSTHGYSIIFAESRKEASLGVKMKAISRVKGMFRKRREIKQSAKSTSKPALSSAQSMAVISTRGLAKSKSYAKSLVKLDKQTSEARLTPNKSQEDIPSLNNQATSANIKQFKRDFEIFEKKKEEEVQELMKENERLLSSEEKLKQEISELKKKMKSTLQTKQVVKKVVQSQSEDDKKIISDLRTQILTLQKSLSQKDELLKVKDEKLKKQDLDFKKQLKELEEMLKNKSNGEKKSEENELKLRNLFTKQKSVLSDRENEVSRLNKELSQFKREIVQLRMAAKQKEDECKSQTETISKLNAEIQHLKSTDDQTKPLHEKIERQSKNLEIQDSEIKKLRTKIKADKETFTKTENELNAKSEAIQKDLNEKIKEMEEQINMFKQQPGLEELSKLKDQITKLKEEEDLWDRNKTKLLKKIKSLKEKNKLLKTQLKQNIQSATMNSEQDIESDDESSDGEESEKEFDHPNSLSKLRRKRIGISKTSEGIRNGKRSETRNGKKSGPTRKNFLGKPNKETSALPSRFDYFESFNEKLKKEKSKAEEDVILRPIKPKRMTRLQRRVESPYKKTILSDSDEAILPAKRKKRSKKLKPLFKKR